MHEAQIGGLTILALAITWAAFDNWRYRKYRDAVAWWIVAGLVGSLALSIWISPNPDAVVLVASCVVGLMGTLLVAGGLTRKITGRENVITRLFDW